MNHNSRSHLFASHVVPFTCTLFVMALWGCQTGKDIQRHCWDYEPSQCQAPRAETLHLNPELEQVKPMGLKNPAGWLVTTNGLLIGPVQPNWLVALSIKSQKPVWWHQTGSATVTALESVGKWVLAGHRNGIVEKISTIDGKTAWTSDLGTYVTRPFTVNRTNAFAITANHKVFAINFETGKQDWVSSLESPGDLFLESYSTAVVYRDTLLVPSPTGSLHSFDIATGKQNWEFTPSNSNTAKFQSAIGPIVMRGGDLTYARFDGLVLSLNLFQDKASSPKERRQSQFSPISATGFRGDILYIGTTDGQVIAFDLSNFRELWKVETGKTITSLTVGEKHLYTTASEGRLMAIDTSSGKVQWLDELKTELSHKPVIIGKKIYFSSGLDTLYGYQLSTTGDTMGLPASSQKSSTLEPNIN